MCRASGYFLISHLIQIYYDHRTFPNSHTEAGADEPGSPFFNSATEFLSICISLL